MEPNQPPLPPQNRIGTDTRAVLQYQANSKSVGVAYLLWFLLGCFGGHRFYTGRIGSAIAMLLIMLFSLVLCVILIGIVGVIAVQIWWIVDAFLIPGWIREFNGKLLNAIGG